MSDAKYAYKFHCAKCGRDLQIISPEEVPEHQLAPAVNQVDKCPYCLGIVAPATPAESGGMAP